MSCPYVSATDALNLSFRSEPAPTPSRMNWTNEQTDGWLRDARPDDVFNAARSKSLDIRLTR